MNVFNRAREQAEQEKKAPNERRHKSSAGKKAEETKTKEGQLVWIGEYRDPTTSEPQRLHKGDKTPMSRDERNLFARTIYERGYCEYSYTGDILPSRTKYADETDPRGGLRDGAGMLQNPNGETYHGTWQAGKREGKGVFRAPWYSYSGTWKDDQIDGSGYEEIPCGAGYYGVFKEGWPADDGVLYLRSNGDKKDYYYTGKFLDGLRHGEGSIVYPNGDIFMGHWLYGMRHGKGVTQTGGPRKLRYITRWHFNRMIGPPVVDDGHDADIRSRPAAAHPGELRIKTTIPADLTKWTVKEDTEDLPLEHFMRIKLGFELLDQNASGSLSKNELEAIWGKQSLHMLRKLDKDNSGTIELSEVFAAWYPRVPYHVVKRYLVEEIDPHTLFQLRGVLAGRVCEYHGGYLHIFGVDKRVKEANGMDYELTRKDLERAKYQIGGFKFSLAMYESARSLYDPPCFGEVLQVLFPNVKKEVINRLEEEEIPESELVDMNKTFLSLSGGDEYIKISHFQAATARYREAYSRRRAEEMENIDSSVTHHRADEPDSLGPGESVASYLDRKVRDGFFTCDPVWRLSDSIELSARLLKDIASYYERANDTLNLGHILRYCYPNVECRHTQDILTKTSQRPRAEIAGCSCCICAFLGKRT